MKSIQHKLAFLLIAMVMTLASSKASLSQLPDPGMEIDGNTALVITDPQNDFLSPDGVTWGVVGESVTENNTVAHIGALLTAAKAAGMHTVWTTEQVTAALTD